MKLTLDLSRREILALDSLIQDSAQTRFPLNQDELIALAIWNGAAHATRVEALAAKIRSIPINTLSALERWFKSEGV